jgi:orotidine-5'-phosphate decarboxylase
MRSKAQLALALDFESRESFEGAIDSLIDSLGDQRPVLKLGLRLLPFLGLQDFVRLKSQGFRLFVDVKLHDIPTQVASSVRTWASFGADYLTIHACGGREMIRAAIEEASRSQIRLLGVLFLTSQDQNDLKDLGIERPVAEHVLHLARLVWSQGLKGFVSSAQELALLKAEWPDVFVCTPGLTLPAETSLNAHSDQKRSLSFEEAIERGSDLLVMGRSIWKSSDPQKTLRDVMKRIEELS